MDVKNKYTHRFLARVVIKAETPLAIGSGEKDVISDKLVVRDVNGLPYIPGTALAGIIRHAIGEEMAMSFFGCSAEDDMEKSGRGSEILFSSAHIIDKDKRVIEGLLPNEERSDYLKLFDELPVRQHVAISDKGVNPGRGKFDEEVVYKGTHFCFEIEMLSDGGNVAGFDSVLKELVSDSFRIGSGTRNGLGRVAVVECRKSVLDLRNAADREAYLGKTSSLNSDKFWETQKCVDPSERRGDWIKYEIALRPEDFYLFGSGFGDDDADMTPVSEVCIDWDYKGDKIPEFHTRYVLIPATSVKGAMAHRIAFYYNQLKGYTVRQIGGKFETDENAKVGVENGAVKALFGYTSEYEDRARRGNVFFSDLMKYEYKEDREHLKILNHVAIDRFTGGAIDGALFTEKVVYGAGDDYLLEILVDKNVFTGGSEEEMEEKAVVKKAFEKTLDDIATGMLPLGGGTNRGNGCFSGEWKIKE